MWPDGVPVRLVGAYREVVAKPLAGAAEGIWGALRRESPPPLTRLAVWLSALECTIDISKARSQLGYEPVKTVEEGMAELRAA